MIPWNPPAPLPRVRPDPRRRFLGEFDCSKRITRRQRALLTDALKAGLVSPEDLAARLGIAPCTSECWRGARLPIEVRPDPARRAFLEVPRTQAATPDRGRGDFPGARSARIDRSSPARASIRRSEGARESVDAQGAARAPRARAGDSEYSRDRLSRPLRSALGGDAVIGLNPESPPWRLYVVERVRSMVLPPPARVRLTLTAEDGETLDLEPLETRLELPGPVGPATWREAVLAELTAACGVDPAGLDIRRLDSDAHRQDGRGAGARDRRQARARRREKPILAAVRRSRKNRCSKSIRLTVGAGENTCSAHQILLPESVLVG